MSYLENFHYQLLGHPTSPRKLVFLHGLMGFGQNWMRIAQAFAEDHHILLLDQRGHGRSFHPATGYSPKDYAEDLHKILEELDWSKIVLVGHSMGGRNALEFTHTYPQMIEKLVIEDIGPAVNHFGSNFIGELLDFIPTEFESKKAAKGFFDKQFIEKFSKTTNVKGLSQFMFANIREDENKKAVWRFYLPGIRESLAQGRAEERWNQIEALEVPTLWIHGEKSQDLSREVFAEILKRNPKIQGVEIKNAGHWVHADKPDDFIRTLLGFL